MRWGWAIFLSLWTLGEASAGKMRQWEKSFFHGAEDGEGNVWAISSDGGGDEIHVYDGKEWRKQKMPFPTGSSVSPADLKRRSDGAVVGVWTMGDSRVAVTHHLGDESKILTVLKVQSEADREIRLFLTDSQNRVWIMPNRKQLFRLEADGRSSLAYELKASDFDGAKGDELNPFVAAEDGQGRLWLGSGLGAVSFKSLRGFLIVDGKDVELCSNLSGLPEGRVTTLARLDDTRMILGVENKGLYSVDIGTSEATPWPGPDGRNFRSPSDLLVQDGNLLLVDYDYPWRVIWRWSGGKWQPPLYLGPRGIFNIWPLGKEGAVVAADPAPWYLPVQGESTRLDWSAGFPSLNRTRAVMRLKTGELMVLDGHAATLMDAQALPPRRVENERLAELFPQQDLVIDAKGGVWYWPEGRRGILRQWTGTAWREHDLSLLQGYWSPETWADQQGRVWILAEGVSYWDLAQKKWVEFSCAQEAFESVLGNPPKFLTPLPEERLNPRSFSGRPWFHRGQILYLEGYSAVHYFDGKAWRKWTALDITGTKGGLTQACLDEEGRPMAMVREVWWRWDGRKFENIGNGKSRTPVSVKTGWPQYLQVDEGQVVRDNRGYWWFLNEQGLHAAREDIWGRVVWKDEVNPFRADGHMQGAFVDGEGTAFLVVGLNDTRFFMIRPKVADPQCKLAVSQPEPDRVVARVEAGEDVMVQWQWDDGDWQFLHGREIRMDFLSPGRHVLKARAFNEMLTVQKEPALAEITVKVERRRQIERLLAGLRDPDFGRREATMKNLSKVPRPELVKALQGARETAPEGVQWWIDAALQELERTKPKKSH